jgi:hypothetical protein
MRAVEGPAGDDSPGVPGREEEPLIPRICELEFFTDVDGSLSGALPSGVLGLGGITETEGGSGDAASTSDSANSDV